jgi:hypothetical protein
MAVHHHHMKLLEDCRHETKALLLLALALRTQIQIPLTKKNDPELKCRRTVRVLRDRSIQHRAQVTTRAEVVAAEMVVTFIGQYEDVSRQSGRR